MGNFLRFQRDKGQLLKGRSIEQLLTESSLRDYIAVLRRRLAPQSVVTQLGVRQVSWQRIGGESLPRGKA